MNKLTLAGTLDNGDSSYSKRTRSWNFRYRRRTKYNVHEPSHKKKHSTPGFPRVQLDRCNIENHFPTGNGNPKFDYNRRKVIVLRIQTITSDTEAFARLGV